VSRVQNAGFHFKDLTVYCIKLECMGDAETRLPAFVGPNSRGDAASLRLKLGPIWRLARCVEPAPNPSDSMILRSESGQVLLIDGPFAETKEQALALGNIHAHAPDADTVRGR